MNLQTITAALLLLTTLVGGCKKDSPTNTPIPPKNDSAMFEIRGIQDLHFDSLTTSQTLSLTTTQLSGKADSVFLSIEGLPAGISASITKNADLPPFTSTVNFTRSDMSIVGNNEVTINARSKSFAKAYKLNLSSAAASPVTFRLDLTEDVFDFSTNAYIYADVVRTGGSDSVPVTLSVTNLPAQMDAWMQKPPSSPTFSSYLTLVEMGRIPEGTYPAVVHASSGSYTVSKNVTIRVRQLSRIIVDGVEIRSVILPYSGWNTWNIQTNLNMSSIPSLSVKLYNATVPTADGFYSYPLSASPTKPYAELQYDLGNFTFSYISKQSAQTLAVRIKDGKVSMQASDIVFEDVKTGAQKKITLDVKQLD